jgi:DNA polymerase III subunit gamma/tau
MSKTTKSDVSANSSARAGKLESSTHHISLYRKYRPAKFSDVIGQDHIVDVLKRSIAENTVGHAYLFSGSRGTGKTSVARIFAQELGVSANDIYEIDAASNNGVDEIRQLREAVQTVPLESKYKVYILDEVHMLSKSAFNAFLKTLEEPPKHCIFILATTETEKIPETIASRCEVYTFKKPSVEILEKVVLDISKKENFDIEKAGANLVALLGDGSFRDTLSILQKVVSLGATSLVDIEQVTGAPKASVVNDFAMGLVCGDKELSYKALIQAEKSNIDMKVFADLVLTRVRYVLALLVTKTESEFFGQAISFEEKEKIANALSDAVKVTGITDITPAKVAGILRSILSIYSTIGKTNVGSLPLEVVVGETVGS